MPVSIPVHQVTSHVTGPVPHVTSPGPHVPTPAGPLLSDPVRYHHLLSVNTSPLNVLLLPVEITPS